MKSFLFFLICASTLFGKEALTPEAAAMIGKAAYIYGYPLIVMEKKRAVMTNVSKPQGARAPMGEFAHAKSFPKLDLTHLLAPETDTLFSVAWVNVSEEPYLFHVPQIKHRYYLFTLLSAWREIFTSIGSRTYGFQEKNFILTGPKWKGELPENVHEIKCPTGLVWIFGKTHCTGSIQDFKAVYQIQDFYRLRALTRISHKFSGKSHTLSTGLALQGGEAVLPEHCPHLPEEQSQSPKDRLSPKICEKCGLKSDDSRNPIDPTIDMKTPIIKQVNALDIEAYFNLMADLMKANPPASSDEEIVKEMAKIGLVPGSPFSLSEQNPEIKKTLEKVPELAQAKILAHSHILGKPINQWIYLNDQETDRTDYLKRAVLAFHGLGTNLPQDQIIAYVNVDQEGSLLNGKESYILHFAKEEMPPVKGLWSLSAYTSGYELIPNALHRYHIDPSDMLKYNYDGSLEIFVQADSPGPNKESNWLPVSNDPFILVFRFYWPEDTLLDGTWKPPPLVKDLF